MWNGQRGQKIFIKKAVTLAVIAHIRHEHTDYDVFLAESVERYEVPWRVEDKIDEILKFRQSETNFL